MYKMLQNYTTSIFKSKIFPGRAEGEKGEGKEERVKITSWMSGGCPC